MAYKLPTCKNCNLQIEMGEPEPAQCPNCDMEEWIEVDEGKAGDVRPCDKDGNFLDEAKAAVVAQLEELGIPVTRGFVKKADLKRVLADLKKKGY